jgi:hypothetical protein
MAARKADDRDHTICRECGYYLKPHEAYYPKDEQREKFGEHTLLIRYPKKDCPSCGAKHTTEPLYEPLYGLPPRRMCLQLAKGDLKDVFLIRTLFAYPDGLRGARRERIRQFWGRDISKRMEGNPRV